MIKQLLEMTDKMPDEIWADEGFRGADRDWSEVSYQDSTQYTRTELINQQLDEVIELLNNFYDDEIYYTLDNAIALLKQMRGN